MRLRCREQVTVVAEFALILGSVLVRDGKGIALLFRTLVEDAYRRSIL